jgi:predicted RNase H-like HicB family nuclease
MQCTAVFQKRQDWYIGWVEEVPGVNTQGKTLKETKDNLREALELVLETRRALLKKEHSRGRVIRQLIRV